MIFCPANPVGMAEGGRPALLPRGWALAGAAATQASSSSARAGGRGSISMAGLNGSAAAGWAAAPHCMGDGAAPAVPHSAAIH